MILSGGREAIPGIKTAKRMGLHVIICDGNKNAPGIKYGDEFIHVNIYNEKDVVKKLLKFSRKRKINGIVTIGTDAVRSVSAITTLLKLPGIYPKTAKLATNKLLMKQSFKKNNIKVPKFTKIDSYHKLKKTIKKFGKSILKPIDSRGSRGILILDSKSNLMKSMNYSKQFSNSKNLILEKWLDGHQLSSESLVINGKSYLCGLADRNYSRIKETYPFVIEDGGETPSVKSLKLKNKINKIMDKIAKIWHIENGILKGDLIFKNNQVYVIEVAARLSGGFFSTITIPLVYEIDIVKCAIDLALGNNVSPPITNNNTKKFQANRFFFFQPGIVKEIKKKKLPKYVKFFELKLKRGQKIKKIENHPMRYGSVLTIGKTRKESIKRAEKIRDSVKITFQ